MHKIKLIIAHDLNYGIGLNGGLPWSTIKEDMRHFKETTIHHPVVMGGETFRSLNMPKGLPHRHNIILSRTLPESPDYTVCRTFEELMDVVNDQLLGVDVFVIGGKQIYELFLSKGLIDQIIISEIQESGDADTYIDWDVCKHKDWDFIHEKYQKFDDFILMYYDIIKDEVQ